MTTKNNITTLTGNKIIKLKLSPPTSKQFLLILGALASLSASAEGVKDKPSYIKTENIKDTVNITYHVKIAQDCINNFWSGVSKTPMAINDHRLVMLVIKSLDKSTDIDCDLIVIKYFKAN